MRKMSLEILEHRRLKAADLALDINADGYVSQVDALLIINAINSVDKVPVSEIPSHSTNTM